MIDANEIQKPANPVPRIRKMGGNIGVLAVFGWSRKRAKKILELSEFGNADAGRRALDQTENRVDTKWDFLKIIRKVTLISKIDSGMLPGGNC